MATNALSSKNFRHPYDLKTARFIRENLIMEKDEDKRKEFLKSLESLFGTRYAEMLRYISKDYRIYLRDGQLWPDYDSKDWVGAVWSCGRALILGAR